MQSIGDVAGLMIEDLSQKQTEAATSRAYPNYWLSNPQQLKTRCEVSRISFGNGLSIYESSIIPQLLSAEHEVILVTCFWAKSETLTVLSEALRCLSAKARQNGKLIRVRICFSSSSLFQKLFHTTSFSGKTYNPSTWQSALGLPSPGELSGLDLRIKSVFVLPFSVMHPKFVVVDRRTVLLPSCNVSWESWFEGCIELKGPVIAQFVTFWQSFWANENEKELSLPEIANPQNISSHPQDRHLLKSHEVGLGAVSCIFLPSPHHRNPCFALPWATCPPAPSTPLNIYLLALFAKAESTIYIQTPNLTSPPVLDALVQSLKRGISVTIVTSERLMILEQLVTAGTTTKRCVLWLVKQHEQLLVGQKAGSPSALEAGILTKQVGALTIRFYEPLSSAGDEVYEPVQSHLKLTVVDGRILVLGSGNLDRASWFTSQELGVAFASKELVEATMTTLRSAMEGRSKVFYRSKLS